MDDSKRITVIVAMLEKFNEHIDRVQKTVRILAKRLILTEDKDNEKLAFLLVRNAFTHDRSKLEGIEFPWIHQIDDKEKLMTAIFHHQQVNIHHPEYWGGVQFMPPVAIAEMVCDWKARSEEKGSGFQEWIKDEAFKKYDIPPTGKVAKLIKKFVDLILDPPFKKMKVLKKEDEK